MDLRIEFIFKKYLDGDTSFQESGLSAFFPKRYNSEDMRETWHRGIKYGIGIGLNHGSIEGQKLDLIQNTTNPKHKEFLEKFYKLANEYNCEIAYHSDHGLMILEKN